ncbi:hypothetical protein GZ77_23405 [Endozoicomonas montiporae]|uniref:Fibronectin type-III domain-containing protein n=2 Tax=Endozoicomonas montiporae TaxID=1027273 RepID=A0A081N0R0_9GAMM|nr:hypothetical protein [Endozoicomonas montiporae]AMO54512.1 hypothetical protein EZMO1_0247 [Endozoicomonas montiporae CL-33]KEQ12033.1 hypothetical protein GZ77_23405 [Endozoicomonas montiporae]
MSESDKQPGIIDPPLGVEDADTLQQWMQQITEATRQGMGQIGSIANSYVKFNDLVDGGFLIPMQPPGGVEYDFTNGPIGGGYYQSSGSASFDLTPPGKVNSVVVSSLIGAMDIEWLPPEMSFPHHYEVWRSTTSDRNDSVLIGTTSALRYSDVNVENGQTYYYWIRIVKTIGSHVIYGSYDSPSGTTGSPKSTVDNILDIVSEDMYIKTPGGNKNPFGYHNLGTDDNPDWVVALRADVAIQGNLAISQLKSGELSNTVALSVGQGSVTMDTRTDGSGQIVVTGKGGVGSNDYLILNQGRIASYVWDGSKHVQYKEVRRIERGVAPAGQLVTVPAYFKAQPTIYLAPFIIPTYNPNYPSQGQQWRLSHSNVEPNPGETGGWRFVPTAQLELTEGNSTQVYPDRTYLGSGDVYETIISRRTSLKKLRVNTRNKSIRSTGAAGNYYKRNVTVQLWYRVYGTSTWLLGKTVVVHLDSLSEKLGVVDYTLASTGDYDIKVRYVAADAGGTFTTGTQYEYTTRTVYGSSYVIADGDVSGVDNSVTVYLGEPTLGGGWGVVKSRWQYDYKLIGQRSGSNDWFGSMERPGTSTYNFHSDNSHAMEGRHTSEAQYHDSYCRFSVGMDYKTSYNFIEMQISNVSVQYTYRRPAPVSTTPQNAFYLDTIEYDQGAQLINPTNEQILVNWLAVGE